MKNIIAFLLITIGTVGATIGVAQTNPQVEGWEHTFQVNLSITLSFLVVMIAGIVLKRTTARSRLEVMEEHKGNRQLIDTALSDSIQQVREIEQNLPKSTLDSLHEALEQAISGPITDFIENRQYLIDSFGISGYAHIMTSFAQAERYLNRAWSASADGYMDESATFVQKAVPALQETKDTLEKHENN